MPTVLLAGAFGQTNPGDEAILRAFLNHLEGWRAIVTSADPESTNREHGCRAISSHDIVEVARQVNRANALVFAGGTVFKQLHPSARRPANDLLRKSLVLAAEARLLRKPVAMLGVGAGRLSGTSRRLAKALARRADLLVLRDEESAALLARCGLPPPFRVGTDLAWTLFGPPRIRASRDNDVVVVALSHLAGNGPLALTIARALRPLVAEGIPVKLQPWQRLPSGGDEELADKIARATGSEIISPPKDLAEATAMFRSSRLVVGFRYHALMAAASAGTPFIAYTHEAKLAGIARRLDQPAVSPTTPPDAFADSIREALNAVPPAPEAVNAEVGAAEDGFRLLRLLLDGGAADPEEVVGLPLRPSPRAP